MTFEKILIVGAGNMGGAMLEGWLAGGVAPHHFTILSPNRSEAPDGVALVRETPETPFDAVVLGFKPYMLSDIAPTLAPAIGADTVVISVLAGVEQSTLDMHFPTSKANIRLMPNLACALGKSPLPLYSDALEDSEKNELDTFFAPLGYPEWLEDEAQFDLVTALAGSGPAFLYRFIDALASGAADLGLLPGQAQRLALAMVEGAADLASRSEHTPGELARRVASPGGVTQAGLDRLDHDGDLQQLISETLQASRDRSVEMAREARE